MSVLITEKDLNCYQATEDCAAITIKNQKYIMDYSILMDFLTELAIVASLIEKSDFKSCKNKISAEGFKNDYH